MNYYALPADQEQGSDTRDSLSQYLSLRFYKENLDNLKDRTKDSINNFLKTLSEIETDFAGMLQNQQSHPWEATELGLEPTAMYLEENY